MVCASKYFHPNDLHPGVCTACARESNGYCILQPFEKITFPIFDAKSYILPLSIFFCVSFIWNHVNNNSNCVIIYSYLVYVHDN